MLLQLKDVLIENNLTKRLLTDVKELLETNTQMSVVAAYSQQDIMSLIDSP